MTGLLTETERERLGQKFASGLGELGALLEDPLVCDVLVNPDGQVFVERVGEAMVATGRTVSAARRASIVKTAVMLGGGQHRDGWPILETRIPGHGWRFEGVLPPIVDAPALAIRKPSRRVIRLEQYVEEGRLSPRGLEAFRYAVGQRWNILVVGGTGSGKTTFANALLQEIATQAPHQRPAVLEDTPELQCASVNKIAMQTTLDVDMRTLLRTSMRMRPDRIVVGEVRGPEAVVLLEAWNTGHDGGVCTVHASSARDGLLRLEQLARQSETQGVREDIARAVQLVAALGRDAQGHRGVRELVRVDGLTPEGEWRCEDLE